MDLWAASWETSLQVFFLVSTLDCIFSIIEPSSVYILTLLATYQMYGLRMFPFILSASSLCSEFPLLCTRFVVCLSLNNLFSPFLSFSMNSCSLTFAKLLSTYGIVILPYFQYCHSFSLTFKFFYPCTLIFICNLKEVSNFIDFLCILYQHCLLKRLYFFIMCFGHPCQKPVKDEYEG